MNDLDHIKKNAGLTEYGYHEAGVAKKQYQDCSHMLRSLMKDLAEELEFLESDPEDRSSVLSIREILNNYKNASVKGGPSRNGGPWSM